MNEKIWMDRTVSDEDRKLIRKLRNRLAHTELPDSGRRGEFRTEWLDYVDYAERFEE